MTITQGYSALANKGKRLKPSPTPTTPALFNAAAIGTNVGLWTPPARQFSSGGTNHNNNYYGAPSSAPMVSSSHTSGFGGAITIHANLFPNAFASSVASGSAAPATVVSPAPNHPIFSRFAPTTANPSSFGAQGGEHHLALYNPQFVRSLFVDRTPMDLVKTAKNRNKNYMTEASVKEFSRQRKKNGKVHVEGGNGLFQNASLYIDCHATSTRLAYNHPGKGKKLPVVVPDSPECQVEVAEALVTYAIEKGWTDYHTAFQAHGRIMRTFFLNNFWGPPLKLWLNDNCFKNALAAAFGNTAKAKKNYEERQLHLQHYWESHSAHSNATVVSHGLVRLDVFGFEYRP